MFCAKFVHNWPSDSGEAKKCKTILTDGRIYEQTDKLRPNKKLLAFKFKHYTRYTIFFKSAINMEHRIVLQVRIYNMLHSSFLHKHTQNKTETLTKDTKHSYSDHKWLSSILVYIHGHTAQLLGYILR